MKLGIITVFYPRMELDHLESWIAYNLALGFSKIYLYDNGGRSVDRFFGSGKKEKVWAKKLEADYHLELSDEEIEERTLEILAPFVSDGSVEVIPWPNQPGKKDFCQSQNRAGRHCLRALEKSGEVDWLAFVDIDELIVSPQVPLAELLQVFHDEGVAGIKMKQKVFESRWTDDGQPRKFQEITRTYGIVSWNKKAFARVGSVKAWNTVHGLRTDGEIRIIKPNFLRFHHFRGNKHFGKITRWAISRYTQLEWKGAVDDEHCRLLTSES